MKRLVLFIGFASAAIFFVGAGYIVYAGRPVIKNAEQNNAALAQKEIKTEIVPKSEQSTAVEAKKNLYTLETVQKHSVKSDCWSVIGGDVYDLTTWVSRHPGGEKAILSLCGTDGSGAFATQHGDDRRPKSMLVLLKIGSVQ